MYVISCASSKLCAIADMYSISTIYSWCTDMTDKAYLDSQLICCTCFPGTCRSVCPRCLCCMDSHQSRHTAGLWSQLDHSYMLKHRGRNGKNYRDHKQES